MEITRPKIRHVWPAWDLPTVLKFLNEPPFEPLQAAPIRSLAKKTLFLVALASGRRCSELHALAIGRSAIFSNSGVTLYFRPGFLVKNERSNFSSNPIFLPYINKHKDRELRLSCPVRAIRWYIDRTQNMRGKIQNLFITNIKPYRAAAKPTLAGWLVETIKDSKAVMEEGEPRAHSVRGYSASWAHANGISMNEIINTVSWRTESTFIKVYMKDITKNTAPGRYATSILETETTRNVNK
jgi:hypothetical protein